MKMIYFFCPTCGNNMNEIGPDLHKCETCGTRADQLNIWGLDPVGVCESCMGLGCKLCGGKGYIGEEKAPGKKKYNNKEIIIDGVKFDSEAEGRFYNNLKQLLAVGKIEKYELQPNFELQPKFKTQHGESIRAITYTADFAVWHLDGSVEIVDIKGQETQQGIMRIKMFKYRYPHLELRIMAELPAKHGGGKGVFVDLSELKKIRKEAAKNGPTQKATPKKAKQASKGKKAGRKR